MVLAGDDGDIRDFRIVLRQDRIGVGRIAVGVLRLIFADDLVLRNALFHQPLLHLAAFSVFRMRGLRSRAAACDGDDGIRVFLPAVERDLQTADQLVFHFAGRLVQGIAKTDDGQGFVVGKSVRQDAFVDAEVSAKGIQGIIPVFQGIFPGLSEIGILFAQVGKDTVDIVVCLTGVV